MEEQPASLIAPSPVQPSLLPEIAGSFFAEMESKGEFTGERLFVQRPDAYKAIVVLLGQKLGVIRIGKLLNVSPNTVMAVRDREGVSIDIVKEHLAAVAHAGATLASEGIVNALNDILQRNHSLGVKDLKDLAVTYGILVQNGQLLAGQPTARVEMHELRTPEHDDYNAYINGLPQAKATHSDAKNPAQKEPAQSAPGASTPVIDVPSAAAPIPAAPPAQADSESEGPPAQAPQPQPEPPR